MKIASWVRASFVVLSLLLTACGGGGGGGGSTPLTYSGATAQAPVTASNAKALSIDAFQGGQDASTLSIMGVAAENNGTQAAVPRLQSLANTLEGSLQQILAARPSGAVTAAGVTESYTISGPAGGSLTYTVSVDPSTYAFNGTVTYNAYKLDTSGAAINGTVTFSGVFNQSTLTFSSFTITFNALTVTEGGTTYTTSGSVTLTATGTTNQTVISMILQNSATGKTYWVKDYTYSYSSSMGTLTLSGTYYDPAYGYVTISTLSPLIVSWPGTWPTGGALLFQGANGSKARLTFTSTGYTVEVDSTGSGVYTTVP